MDNLEDFKAQLDAKTADEVREDTIFMFMMVNMVDREDAAYTVDEMVSGEMPDDDLGPYARAAIARIARG